MNKLLIYTNVKFYLIYIHCVMIMGKCMFVSVTLCESNNCPFLSWSFKKYFYIFTFYTFKNTKTTCLPIKSSNIVLVQVVSHDVWSGMLSGIMKPVINGFKIQRS